MLGWNGSADRVPFYSTGWVWMWPIPLILPFLGIQPRVSLVFTTTASPSSCWPRWTPRYVCRIAPSTIDTISVSSLLQSLDVPGVSLHISCSCALDRVRTPWAIHLEVAVVQLHCNPVFRYFILKHGDIDFRSNGE